MRSTEATATLDSIAAEARPATGATPGVPQLHRWFQLYERALARQREILHERVEIHSTNGQATGHRAYTSAVLAMPRDQQNAHRVVATRLSHLAEDRIAVAADVRYQRLKDDGELTTLDLAYQTELQAEDGAAPLFTRIAIEVKANAEAERFVDAYAENRARSHLHRWLFLIESLSPDAEPFREMLVEDGLHLAFPSAPITSFEQFATWLGGAPQQLRATSHGVEALEIRSLDNGEIELRVQFPWRAIGAKGQRIVGRTQHEWRLVDRGERYPRLRSARVEWLEPMRILD